MAGSGKRQQAWGHPQGKKNQSPDEEHSASLGPANPQTHQRAKPPAREVLPLREPPASREARAMSFSWSSTQSPGFREKTMLFETLRSQSALLGIHRQRPVDRVGLLLDVERD